MSRFVQMTIAALMLMAATFYGDQIQLAQGSKLSGAVRVDRIHDYEQEAFGIYVGDVYEKRAMLCGKLGHIDEEPVEYVNDDRYVGFDFKTFFFRVLGLYQDQRSVESITKDDLCPMNDVYDHDGIVPQGYVGSISLSAVDPGSSTPDYHARNYGRYYNKEECSYCGSFRQKQDLDDQKPSKASKCDRFCKE